MKAVSNLKTYICKSIILFLKLIKMTYNLKDNIKELLKAFLK